jgi:spore germination protein KC
MISILSIVCFCIGSTGCWDNRELDDLAIITAMGIDKRDGQFILTTQVVNPSAMANQKKSEKQSPVVTYKTKGKSISEALQRRITLSDRENYTSQMKVLVIGENLAREGIGDILDYLFRSRDIEPTFYICIAKGNTAENTLDVMTPYVSNPADMIYNSIKTQIKNKGTVIGTMPDDLIANLYNEGEEAKLTGIEIIGSKEKGKVADNTQKIAPDTFLKVNNIGVLHGEKLVGWLSEIESKGLNFILDQMQKSKIEVPCPGNPLKKAVMEIIQSKTAVESKSEHHHPVLSIQVHTQFNLLDIQCKGLRIDEPQTMKRLNQLAQKEITLMIKTTLYALQKKYKTDVVQFGREVYRSDPTFWKQNKTRWDQLFVHLPIKVECDASVTFTGMVSDPLSSRNKGAER